MIKNILFCLALAYASSACSNGNETAGIQEPAKGKIDAALKLMRQQVTDDVELTIAPQFILSTPDNDMSYFVCGKALVNQPGLVDHKTQRYISRFNSDRHGITYFDGRSDQEGKDEFQKNWDKHCNAPTISGSAASTQAQATPATLTAPQASPEEWRNAYNAAITEKDKENDGKDKYTAIICLHGIETKASKCKNGVIAFLKADTFEKIKYLTEEYPPPSPRRWGKPELAHLFF